MKPRPTPPVVSVVIPCFNQGRFVRSTVESVLAQSFSDLEVIAVDDGSTDDTPERLQAICDPRLHVIRVPNSGVSRARNLGIEAARGRYVGFIDGDDIWLPGKVQRHVALLEEQPDVDLTFSRSRLIDDHGRDMGRASRWAPRVLSFSRLFRDNVVANGSAVILRRTALDRVGGFDPDFATLADYEMWLRIALLRPRNVHFIAEPLSLYRVHSGQMTDDWRRSEREWMALCEKMRRLAPDLVASSVHRAMASMRRHFAYLAYEARDYPRAARSLALALCDAPLEVLPDRRTWVLASALLAEVVLPNRFHRALDEWMRELRRRRFGPERCRTISALSDRHDTSGAEDDTRECPSSSLIEKGLSSS